MTDPHATAVDLLTPTSGRRTRTDRLATMAVIIAFVVAAAPLFWILWAVLSNGWQLVVQPGWWWFSQRNVTPTMTGGGAYHAVVGTLLQTAACAAIAIPIGIFTAVYLVEYGTGRWARGVSFAVDILTGIPSIVAALFIYATWVGIFGLGRVGFAVSLALVLLMIPVVVRSTEEMLHLVPMSIREAALGLGVSRSVTIVRVVLPSVISGITTGVLLGLARVMGETAPLLILGPYTASINRDLFHGFQAALPTMIKDQFDNPDHPAIQRMWASAMTLIALVMICHAVGRYIARRHRVVLN